MIVKRLRDLSVGITRSPPFARRWVFLGHIWQSQQNQAPTFWKLPSAFCIRQNAGMIVGFFTGRNSWDVGRWGEGFFLLTPSFGTTCSLRRLTVGRRVTFRGGNLAQIPYPKKPRQRGNRPPKQGPLRAIRGPTPY